MFWQVLTCKPGEVAAASAGNTGKIKKLLMKFAKTEPYNYIRVPEDICKIKGGSISTNGGNSFQMKF